MTLETPVLSKPKLRGVFHEFGFYAALGLCSPARSDRGAGPRARLGGGVLDLRGPLFRRQRSLPPSDLVAEHPLLARAPRPRRRVPADRRNLHALRPPRPLARLGDSGPCGRLDRRRRGHRAEGVLAEGAQASLGRDRDHARVGRRRRHLAAPQAPRRRARPRPRRRCVLHAWWRSSTPAGDPTRTPRVLGYHEVFHLLTLVAASCQYAAIAFYVLPRA